MERLASMVLALPCVPEMKKAFVESKTKSQLLDNATALVSYIDTERREEFKDIIKFICGRSV